MRNDQKPHQDRQKQDCHLFRTYAKAFKGQRQLYWSNGLRALLAMGTEATDEELAAMQEDKAIHLATLTLDQWRVILKRKLETALLDMAETCPGAIPDFLHSIEAAANGTVWSAERSEADNQTV
jgi:hypothetical protein